MAHYDLITGLDLLQAALLDAGESTSISGDYGDDAKRAVRDAYWSVLAYARWPWAMAATPGVLTTTASRRVTVSSISTGFITLSSTLSPSAATNKIYLDSNQSVYYITAHTSGTNLLVLDANYVETEISAPAVIFKDTYALPDGVLRVWDPMWPRGWQDTPIPIIDKPLFELRYGRGSVGLGSGIIEAACEIRPLQQHATSGNMIRQLRIAPWSEDALNIEYDYTEFHNLDFSGSMSTDAPRVPREHRSVIAKFAAASLLIGKDDAKAKDYAEMGAGRLRTMLDQYLPSQSGRLYVHPKHSATLGMC